MKIEYKNKWVRAIIVILICGAFTMYRYFKLHPESLVIATNSQRATAAKAVEKEGLLYLTTNFTVSFPIKKGTQREIHMLTKGVIWEAQYNEDPARTYRMLPDGFNLPTIKIHGERVRYRIATNQMTEIGFLRNPPLYEGVAEYLEHPAGEPPRL